MRSARGRVVLAAGAGAAAVVAAAGVPAPAQTITTRDVKVTIECKVQRGEPITLCRGTWRMTGEIRDAGKIRRGESNDRSGTGASLRGVLDGRKGEVAFSDSGVHWSHRRRDCDHVTSFSLRGETGGFTGFRGSTTKPVCVKLRTEGRSTTRRSVFNVALSKRE